MILFRLWSAGAAFSFFLFFGGSFRFDPYFFPTLRVTWSNSIWRSAVQVRGFEHTKLALCLISAICSLILFMSFCSGSRQNQYKLFDLLCFLCFTSWLKNRHLSFTRESPSDWRSFCFWIENCSDVKNNFLCSDNNSRRHVKIAIFLWISAVDLLFAWLVIFISKRVSRKAREDTRHCEI